MTPNGVTKKKMVNVMMICESLICFVPSIFFVRDTQAKGFLFVTNLWNPEQNPESLEVLAVTGSCWGTRTGEMCWAKAMT